MKKYFSEMIGTFVLVFMGCGTAMLVGCDPVNGGGYILTALAFGLSIVAMAYCVGNISGGHFNAAVTFAMLIRKKISGKDAGMYCIFQLIGAFVAFALSEQPLRLLSIHYLKIVKKSKYTVSNETVTFSRQGKQPVCCFLIT